MFHFNDQVPAQVSSIVVSLWRSAQSVQLGLSRSAGRPRRAKVLVPGAIASLLVGCNQVQPLNPEFTMQIQPTGTVGTYSVAGQTNLKAPTAITIQAIRKLRPLANAVRLTNREPLYAVVAEERVETQEGKWQTTLKLLQPNSAGTTLESWQISQDYVPLELEPDVQVSFVAVTAPLDRSIRFVDLNAPGLADTKTPVLQSATDGSNYLKAEQVIAITPPTVSRSLAKSADRPVVQVRATASQPAVSSKQTTAPLTSQEFVR